MRVILCSLLLLLWPLAGHAVPVQVQTGEHADFTRVVISIPEGSDWRLGRTSDGYVVRLTDGDGFAIAGFFELIPKDRILAVSQDPSAKELHLRVDCDCNVRASVYRANFLVIDVRDGPPSHLSPFEFPLPNRPSAVSARPPENAALLPYQVSRNRLLPVITPRIRFQQTEDADSTPSTKEAAAPFADDQKAPSDDTEQTLRAITQSLTESLGRGLSEGLLLQGPSRRSVIAADFIGPTLQSSDWVFPGFSTTTSVDPLAVASARPEPQSQVGQTCLPEAAFNIDAWGNDDPPHVQLRDARAILFDPADQFEDGALLALARLYVFLGFGREAEQALELDGTQSRERAILRAIARIIDTERVSENLFTGQVSCPTNVALWALLAQSSGPTDAQVDRTAVINAFRALPPYVKQAIAPRLAEALLAIGAQDAAMQVLGGRSPPKDGRVGFQLAEAVLADALGDEAEAIETIASVARTAPRTTPEALTRFFVEGVKNDVPFSDADFLLADAIRFEHAQVPEISALVTAQFNAYLSVNQFEHARGLLQQEQPPLTVQERDAARAALFLQAAERMPDGAFLEFIWEEAPEGMDGETQNVIAGRLIDLGFDDRALKFLEASADDEVAMRQTVLRLRAEAVSRDRETAQQVLVEEDDNEDEGRVPPGTIDAPQLLEGPSLGNSHALVKDAADLRKLIREMLQSVPAPAEL